MNVKSFINVWVVDNLNGKSVWYIVWIGIIVVCNVKYKKYYVDFIIFLINLIE